MDNSHLNLKWKIDPIRPDHIIAVAHGGGFWNICWIPGNIPGDMDGELVAQQIVDDHNAMLELRKAKAP